MDGKGGMGGVGRAGSGGLGTWTGLVFHFFEITELMCEPSFPCTVVDYIARAYGCTYAAKVGLLRWWWWWCL